MSQEDIDKIKKTIGEGFTKAYDAAAEAEAKASEATQQVSISVRKGISSTLSSMYSGAARLQDASQTAEAHLKSSEEVILSEVRDKVKSGIQWCIDYPLFSYSGAALGIILFPAPRAFILKHVFGVFQSQESAFRAASERFATLSESAQSLTKQKAAAVESATAALDAFSQAKTNAQAASQSLASLEAQLGKIDEGFNDIRESMAPLKHKDVIVLRSDVARTASEVRTDKKEVLQLLAKLRAQQLA